MPIAMATLRRLLSISRLAHSGKVPTSTTLVSRGFCHRASHYCLSRNLSVLKTIPCVSGNTGDNVILRSYATSTKKRPTSTKKTTTKRKTATKKTPAKKSKKTAAKKKKVVKKRKVAKKPKKPTRPKVLDIPSSRGISGYVVFLQDRLKSVGGPGATGRLTDAVSQWKALSDSEKQVCIPPLRLSS
jgi:hypothetical protein